MGGSMGGAIASSVFTMELTESWVPSPESWALTRWLLPPPLTHYPKRYKMQFFKPLGGDTAAETIESQRLEEALRFPPQDNSTLVEFAGVRTVKRWQISAQMEK